MKKAYLFPGQGSQMEGMGEQLCKLFSSAPEFLDMADDVLGYKISDLMFNGTKEQLRETRITQTAVYTYAVIKARCMRNFVPDMVAGHSLGEFSALASVRAFSFAEGLKLVQKRGDLMQELCEKVPSGMAAVLGLDDVVTEAICNQITQETGEVVVPANYNCPGQLVISGTKKGLEIAAVRLKEGGARTVLPLKNVHGGFHSPVMAPARNELAHYIENMEFKAPLVPVYQNVTARPSQDPEEIKANLIAHLTSPVRWTEQIENMVMDGATQFFEVGARPVLASMVSRINRRFTPVFL